MQPADVVELRLIDPPRNRFRVYVIAACETLFGEPGLRLAWGRLGQRRLREVTETFADFERRRCRREELLEQRRQHGYEPVGTDWTTLLGVDREETARGALTAGPLERDIVEAHGLSLDDRTARLLVTRWLSAARELRLYVRTRSHEDLDLDEVSTLAAMYAGAARVA